MLGEYPLQQHARQRAAQSQRTFRHRAKAILTSPHDVCSKSPSVDLPCSRATKKLSPQRRSPCVTCSAHRLS